MKAFRARHVITLAEEKPARGRELFKSFAANWVKHFRAMGKALAIWRFWNMLAAMKPFPRRLMNESPRINSLRRG